MERLALTDEQREQLEAAMDRLLPAAAATGMAYSELEDAMLALAGIMQPHIAELLKAAERAQWKHMPWYKKAWTKIVQFCT